MGFESLLCAKDVQVISNAWIENGYEREAQQNLDGAMVQLIRYMDILNRPRDSEYLARVVVDISDIMGEIERVQEIACAFVTRQIEARDALLHLSNSRECGVVCGAARAMLQLAKGQYTSAYLAIREFVV